MRFLHFSIWFQNQTRKCITHQNKAIFILTPDGRYSGTNGVSLSSSSTKKMTKSLTFSVPTPGSLRLPTAAEPSSFIVTVTEGVTSEGLEVHEEPSSPSRSTSCGLLETVMLSVLTSSPTTPSASRQEGAGVNGLVVLGKVTAVGAPVGKITLGVPTGGFMLGVSGGRITLGVTGGCTTDGVPGGKITLGVPGAGCTLVNGVILGVVVAAAL